MNKNIFSLPFTTPLPNGALLTGGKDYTPIGNAAIWGVATFVLSKYGFKLSTGWSLALVALVEIGGFYGAMKNIRE